MTKDRIYLWYSAEHWFYKHGMRYVSVIIRGIIRIIFSADVPYAAEIGVGTEFPHDALGMVMHPATKIGKNCHILHGCTFGGRGGDKLPVIGDNVLIGAHCIILGDVHIGNNASIGAGSVVIADVPENAVVVGNPARIVRIKDCEDSNKKIKG